MLSVCLLPSAQVSEAELEAIARMGDAAALDVEMAAAGAGGAATRALLGEYTTPARWAAGVALGMVLGEEENTWLGLCNAFACSDRCDMCTLYRLISLVQLSKEPLRQGADPLQ
jgi:hypothetical protein